MFHWNFTMITLFFSFFVEWVCSWYGELSLLWKLVQLPLSKRILMFRELTTAEIWSTQATVKSINQPIFRLLNQPITHSINQSINHILQRCNDWCFARSEFEPKIQIYHTCRPVRLEPLSNSWSRLAQYCSISELFFRIPLDNFDLNLPDFLDLLTGSRIFFV